jgi:IS5 family transposase
MDRNWLKGEVADAIHAVLCAAGYNIRWLMRVILARIFSPVYVSLVLGIWAQIFKERFVGFLTDSTMDSEMDLRLA